MFFGLRRENCGMKPVAVDTWEGFIFINLAPKPAETLKESLGGMGEHLSGFPYHDFPTRYVYRAELKSNWKVCLDAFSEAYHVVFIHQQTVGAINITKENPMHHPLSVRLYERHRSAVVQGNPDFKPTPTGKIASHFGLTSMVRGYGMDTLPPHINPERRNDFNFDLNVIFPNFLVHVRPGEYFTHQFWPLSHDRTLWEGINYLPAARNAGQRFSQEYSHLMRRNAWLEDTSTMEATYAGLATGALLHFMLSDPRDTDSARLQSARRLCRILSGQSVGKPRRWLKRSCLRSFRICKGSLAGRFRPKWPARSADVTARSMKFVNFTMRCYRA